MKETIEKLVAGAILEEPIEIMVLGEIYKIAPPTARTLIKASEYISQLPKLNIDAECDEKQIANEVLANAFKCEFIGDILAILMLGNNGLKTTKKICNKRFFGLRKTYEEIEVNNQAILAEKLLDNLPPKTILMLIYEILRLIDVNVFFSLITSLQEINLLSKTKKT